MLNFKVPGKLMLCGEYAVLEAGEQALMLAVDRYLHFEVQAASSFSLESTLWPEPQVFQLASKNLWQGTQENSLFAKFALQAVAEQLRLHNSSPRPCHIMVRSEMQTKTQKLGLGSSAAFTVGLIKGLLEWHERPLDQATLFQLAYQAHKAAQGGRGSGSDIATSVYGSCAYSPPQNNSEAKIDTLQWPQNWPFAVGFSGQSASTPQFISAYQSFKQKEPQLWSQFLTRAQKATKNAIQALKNQKLEKFVAALQDYRNAIAAMDTFFSDKIEPQTIKTLIEETAPELALKTSGAGGGDCLIATGPQNQLKALTQHWHNYGIKTLDIAPHKD